MGDFPNDAVNFKIDPVFIPSDAVTKLEPFAHSSGGIGDIWKCALFTQTGESKVAVKAIRTNQMDEQKLCKTAKAIRREAYVWIKLSHDHVLPLDGITDGFGKLPALVSRWMEKGALNDYLRTEFSTLTDLRKLELIRQVAGGLRYLHGEDVVHGDLTGSNILIDRNGNVRLADFGLSMIAAEAGNFTFASVQAGNTRWMAPEYLEYSDDPELPLKPTKPGDIYSFGCVMLQIISGQEPYPKVKVAMHVIAAILHGKSPFHDVKMSMNGCNQLSSRCLSKTPKDRPAITEIAIIIAAMNETSLSDGGV